MDKTYLVGKSVAVLLHRKDLIGKVPVLLHTEPRPYLIMACSVVMAVRQTLIPYLLALAIRKNWWMRRVFTYLSLCHYFFKSTKSG